MTESEAKTILERDLNCLKQNKALPDSIEAMEIAINALEKQEKIKDLLDSCTAYPDDMCDCLVEIEKILRSDER